MVGTKRLRGRLGHARSQARRHGPQFVALARRQGHVGPIALSRDRATGTAGFYRLLLRSQGRCEPPSAARKLAAPHLFHREFTDAGEGKTEISIRWVPYEATEAERKVFEDGKDS